MKAYLIAAAISLCAFHVQATEASLGCGAAQAENKSFATEFEADPSVLLKKNPAGSVAMVNDVRQLVIANKDYPKLIIEVAKNATDEQSAAIGAGLARGVQACKNPASLSQLELDYVAEIMKLVAEVNASNPSLVAAFQSALNDVKTGAVMNGSGAVAGGSVSSLASQRSASNNYRYAASEAVQVGGGEFDVGVGSVAVVSPTE